MTFHTVQDKLHQNLREIVCHEIDIVLDEELRLGEYKEL